MDTSFDIIPEVRVRPQGWGEKPSFIRHFASYAFTLSGDRIEKALASCGRCHNWAILSIYQLSVDKFFSFAMLLFWRWDFWVLTVMFVIAPLCLLLFAITRPASVKDLCDCIDALLELCFVALAIYDSFNLREQLLHDWVDARTSHNDPNGKSKESSNSQKDQNQDRKAFLHWKIERILKYFTLILFWSGLLCFTSSVVPLLPIWFTISSLHY